MNLRPWKSALLCVFVAVMLVVGVSPMPTPSVTFAADPVAQPKILMGPVLGWFDWNTFTVSAYADGPVEWSLGLDSSVFAVKLLRPQPSPYQTFQVTRLPQMPGSPLPPARIPYTLRARLPGSEPWQVSASGSINMDQLGERWTFVALGDSRTEPARWKSVVTAAALKDPRFIVHTGDFVGSGTVFQQWIDEFARPAQTQLATISFYAVLGNHEGGSETFDRIIATPGPRDHWAQLKGNVLLIGLDGGRDWSAQSDLYKWLETILKDSRAPFIFVFSHYPVLSSSAHSGVDAQGKYVESAMRQAHDSLMPLCVKYHVTAFIAGHDHCYERSEPPGLTAITAGGAGAPSYGKRADAETQNPFSKVFHAGLHYLLLTVTPEGIHMDVLTPEGQVLDQRDWKPRPATP